MSSLAAEFPIQQARARELLSTYHELQQEFGAGVNVSFACAVIEQTLAEADRAVASGDVLAMIRSFQALKDLA